MAARRVAHLLRRPILAWDAWWTVDPTAARTLVGREVFAARLEEVEARNAAAQRSVMMEYARRHVLPRVAFVPGGVLPTLLPHASSAASTARGLSPFNHNLILLALGGAPVLLTLATVAYLDGRADDGKTQQRALPKRSTHVLDARVAALEAAGAVASTRDVAAAASLPEAKAMDASAAELFAASEVDALRERIARLEAALLLQFESLPKTEAVADSHQRPASLGDLPAAPVVVAASGL